MASYTVGSDRSFPNQYQQNWQHINTIGISWGYNKMQTPDLYKNGSELMSLYQKTVSLGGSFLLNIGPKYDGTLDENEVNSIEEFIKLIH